MAKQARRVPRLAAVCGLLLLALGVLALFSGRHAAGAPAQCQDALRLTSDPGVAEFKACAGASPIPVACCSKLAPFIEYASCLQDPNYKALADSFLAPEVTVDRALKDCLGF